MHKALMFRAFFSTTTLKVAAGSCLGHFRTAAVQILAQFALAALLLGQNQSQPVSNNANQPQTGAAASTDDRAPDGQQAAKLDHLNLRYRLLQHFDQIFICGPPIKSERFIQDELARFPAVQKDTAAFGLILQRLEIKAADNFSDQQKLSILSVYNQLRAARLEPVKDGYDFQIKIFDLAHQVRGTPTFLVEGRIDGQGQIVVVKRTPTYIPCPKCSRAKSVSTT